MAEPMCVVPAGDWTGEGAVWHAEEQAVYWVDINRFLIHRYEPATGDDANWFFAEPPTALGLTDRADTLVVALGSRVILWQPANDARADFAIPSRNWPHVRFNDGRPDPAGNFWVGYDAEQRRRRRQRHPRSTTSPRHGSSASTADGTSTRREDRHRHHQHVLLEPGQYALLFRRHARQRDLRLGLRHRHRRPSPTSGRSSPASSAASPDGSAMDREGYLWNARYGGDCVVRISPPGKVDRVIEMPVSAITTCTFGGPGPEDALHHHRRRWRRQTGANASPAGSSALEVDVPGCPKTASAWAG